jgi:thioredoxin-dependent peroxiredoxin
MTAVAVGDMAPDFTAMTEEGAPFTLSSLRGRPVALYFFPKANTTGCTMETRAFADHYQELQQAGWAVVGVSVDSVTTQKQFQSKCHAAFHLVADTDKSVARAYDVLGFLGFARRVTFLIGPDGRVVDMVSAMTPSVHVKRTLEVAHSPAST